MYAHSSHPPSKKGDQKLSEVLVGRQSNKKPQIPVFVTDYVLCINITARKRSLRRLCFYTCLSVILFTGVGVPGQVQPPWAGTPPPAGTPLAGTPPAGTPPGQVHPQVGTPPGAVHAGRYGQQAGGTHPTGMYSCFSKAISFNIIEKLN